MAKKGKSLLDYAVTVGARGGNRLCMLIVTVLLARMLGPDDFGRYSLFFGIFIVLFQAYSGINIAYVRSVKSGDLDEPTGLRFSLYFQLGVSALVAIVGWPLARYLGHLLDLPQGNALYLGFLASALLGIYGVWFGYFQARGRFGQLGLATLAFNGLILCLVLPLWLAGVSIGVSDIITLYAGTAAILGLLGGLYLLRSIHGSAAPAGEFAGFSRMALMNIAVTSLYFVYRYVDVYFIAYFLSAVDVGVYSAAMKTSMLLSVLVGALPTILLPKAVACVSSAAQTRRYFYRAYLLAAGICAAFALFWLFSPFFLNLLFGDDYTAGGPVLQWLVVGWVFNVLYIPIAQIFYGLNKVHWRLLLEALKLVLTVVGMLVFVPAYGIVGAAYAIAMAVLVTLLLSIPAAVKCLRDNYRITQT